MPCFSVCRPVCDLLRKDEKSTRQNCTRGVGRLSRFVSERRLGVCTANQRKAKNNLNLITREDEQCQRAYRCTLNCSENRYLTIANISAK